MKKVYLEIISGFMLIAISVWFIFQALQFSSPEGSDEVGPGGFPIGIAILIIIFSLFLIIKSIYKIPGESKIFVKRAKKVFISIGVFIIYGLAISFVGIYIASAIFLPMLLLLANVINWKTIISVTIAYEIFAFIVFDTLLNVPLP